MHTEVITKETELPTEDITLTEEGVSVEEVPTVPKEKKGPVIPTTPYVIADVTKSEEAKSLLDKITWVTQCFSKNPVVPILENLLFHNGVIYCSNLAVTQMIFTDIAGTFLVPATQLKKILKELDKKDAVSFGGEGTNLDSGLYIHINGKRIFKINAEHPMDFPKTPICKDTVAEFTGPKDFDKLMTLKKYASTDELRPSMTGIFFDKENAVTTNGHLLCQKKLEDFVLHHERVQILMPVSVVAMIKDFKHATIKEGVTYPEGGSGTTNFLIKEETRAVVFRNIDGNFPDYKSVVPSKQHISVSVSKKALVKIVKLAMLAANATTHQGRFKLVHGTEVLGLESCDLDFSHEFIDEIPATNLTWTAPITREYHPEETDPDGKVTKEARWSDVKGEQPKAGDVFEIGVNLKMFLPLITDSETDIITLKLKAPNQAIIVNEDFLIMPVMLAQYD